MKKLLLLVLIFSFSISTKAQMSKNDLPKGSISGKIVDKATNEALPYVNIIIKDTTEKLITGGITDEKGLFKIKNIPIGKSHMEIQFIGYKTVKKDITLTSKNLNLGTIALEEDSMLLDEVEIRAETSTVVQKVDRKVINVGKDLTSSGTTASELLNNVQSVSVDSQTGNISLRGNENVRVLIDGKPTNMDAGQLLQQIPSSSIKSVELITNPSAKYNPEGMSGIINIILNKNANIGFNGSINTGITAGHFVRNNFSTNMNYKKGKVNFFANYGVNLGKRYNYGFIDRFDDAIYQDFKFINNNRSHLAKLGADIYLNDKNTLSIYTTQNWFDMDGNGNVLITDNNVLTFDTRNTQIPDNKNQTYNLNYKLDFDKKGHNIEFEANYSTNKNIEDATNSDLINIDNTNLNYITDITVEGSNTLINVDYTNPISKDSKLELGLEYRKNITENDNITTQLSVDNSDFYYDRNIISAYANYNKQIGKLSLQIGARLEQYTIEGIFNQEGEDTKTVTDEIFSVYPSAFFTYKPTDKNQFQFSYSRRVDRPSISQVNPIREWSTPLITSIGNTELVPQFTNSIEFNFTRKIKAGSFTIGSFYRNVNDVISRVVYQDIEDDSNVRQILSFTNFNDTDAFGLEFSTNLKLAKWWRANASMDVYSQTQFGTTDISNPNAETIKVNNDVFNARLSNSFTISKKLRMQLFAMYRGASEDIQWQTKPMWMVNTGASYNVLKGKGTISLKFNDIFQGMKFAFKTATPEAAKGQFNWESRTTFLGFNYRFGSGKNKAKQRRRRDNNEKGNSGGMF